MRDAAERPLLRPWITLDPDPVMMYSDARGRVVRLALNAIDLASLGLSIATIQAALFARDLNSAVHPAQSQDDAATRMQPSNEGMRG